VKRVIWILVAAVIGLWLTVALVVFASQRNIVFPRHLLPPVSRLDTLSRDVQEVTVDTADGERLYGLWKPPAPGCSVVVSFHGIASIPGWAAERFSNGPWADHGWGVLAIAYRGYPGSTGTPSETGLLEDGNAALAFVQKTAPGSPILVHGHSLGTGVAIAMAATHEVVGAYLEAPYASLLSLAKRQFQYLPGFLMRDPMRSDLRIGQVRAPILAVHGKQDPVIPVASAREIIAKASPSSHLVEVDGDHVSILGQADEEAEPKFRPVCQVRAAGSP
jgi:fermentation-respiration switch protein FrsA (DUF1100 family)